MGKHVLARCVSAGVSGLVLAGTFASSMAFSAWAQDAAPDAGLVERGRYLATIGICESCHTPKDAQGNSLPDAHVWRPSGGRDTRLQYHARPRDGHRRVERPADHRRHQKRQAANGEQVRPPMGVFFYRGFPTTTRGRSSPICAPFRPSATWSSASRPRALATYAPVENVKAPDIRHACLWKVPRRHDRPLLPVPHAAQGRAARSRALRRRRQHLHSPRRRPGRIFEHHARRASHGPTSRSRQRSPRA